MQGRNLTLYSVKRFSMLNLLGEKSSSVKYRRTGTSLAIQWLEIHTSAIGDMSSIPDWGTKIPHAMQHGQK